MKPLVKIQRLLTWLCAYNGDKQVNRWEKYAFVLFGLLIFAGNLSATVSSAVFVWKYALTDLEQSLCALFQVCGSTAVTYVCIIEFLMRDKTTATIKRLSEIYDENQGKDSFGYLEQANNKSEWFLRAYFKYVVGGFAASTAATSIVSVLVCYLITFGHFESTGVQRPFKLILPWNQATPLGYFEEMCYSIFFGETHFISNGAFILLFISICLHHQAFSKIFSHKLNQLNRPQNDQNNKAILCELIQFHVSVKDWFLQSTKIYSPLILLELICFTGFLACSVFQLDLVTYYVTKTRSLNSNVRFFNHLLIDGSKPFLFRLYFKHVDFMICLIISTLLTGSATLYCYCHFGNLATESFTGMADSLYNIEWYSLPVALQKYFIPMVANSQKPLYFHGFNIAILNLGTFLAVLRSVSTYYMMFKTLTTD